METAALRRFLHRLAERLNAPAGFSVVLISDRGMRRYQSQFSGKDQSTDVLSFPFDQNGREEPYLGDILISVEAAARQEIDGLEAEIQALSLHGLLHLMGYDHEVDGGEMERFEKKLRKEFKLR